MRLIFEKELTPTRFGEIGRDSLVFRDPARKFIAVCSEVNLAGRVSLYTARYEELVAVLDLAHTINDINFHPTDPRMVIAAGSYDGGWHFCGELVHWRWDIGEIHTILGESRDVIRCRFSGPSSVTFLMRPRDEEEYWPDRPDLDPGATYIGGTVEVHDPHQTTDPTGFQTDPRLTDLHPGDPADHGFNDPENHAARSGFAAELDLLEAAGYDERLTIHDLLWISSSRYVAASRSHVCEVRDIDWGRLQSFTGVGYGVDLAPLPGDAFLVTVSRRPSAVHPGLPLYRWIGGKLTLLHEFPHEVLVSTDPSGTIVARSLSSSHGPRIWLIEPGGEVSERPAYTTSRIVSERLPDRSIVRSTSPAHLERVTDEGEAIWPSR